MPARNYTTSLPSLGSCKLRCKIGVFDSEWTNFIFPLMKPAFPVKWSNLTNLTSCFQHSVHWNVGGNWRERSAGRESTAASGNATTQALYAWHTVQLRGRGWSHNSNHAKYAAPIRLKLLIWASPVHNWIVINFKLVSFQEISLNKESSSCSLCSKSQSP